VKLPTEATVRVAARNIVPRDAVGNFTVSVAELYTRHGLKARLYAHDSHPDLADVVAPYSALDADIQPGDILFFNFSTEDELLSHILTLPWGRKILYYHNVTHGCWFREEAPEIADMLDRAREQFVLFTAFDAAFANSRYSLKEIIPFLRAGIPTSILAPELSPGRLLSLDPELLILPADIRFILWVGRLAPHKRPEFALEIFARLCGRLSDICLVMVGGGRLDFANYVTKVEQYIAAMPDGIRAKVFLMENLNDAQLAWLYRRSSLLLCTSGHEGYCLPVSEAMSFGLPVAVFPQEAVEETLGGYGTILPEDVESASAVLEKALQINAAKFAPLPQRRVGDELLLAAADSNLRYRRESIEQPCLISA
jgi:glycosyltransferase involved in cell wall biosynthesis